MVAGALSPSTVRCAGADSLLDGSLKPPRHTETCSHSRCSLVVSTLLIVFRLLRCARMVACARAVGVCTLARASAPVAPLSLTHTPPLSTPRVWTGAPGGAVTVLITPGMSPPPQIQ